MSVSSSSCTVVIVEADMRSNEKPIDENVEPVMLDVEDIEVGLDMRMRLELRCFRR